MAGCVVSLQLWCDCDCVCGVAVRLLYRRLCNFWCVPRESCLTGTGRQMIANSIEVARTVFLRSRDGASECLSPSRAKQLAHEAKQMARADVLSGVQPKPPPAPRTTTMEERMQVHVY